MGEEEGTQDTFGSGTRIWSPVLGGGWAGDGGGDGEAPTWGRGARARVLGRKGGRGGQRTRARSVAAHVMGTPRTYLHVTGCLRLGDAVFVIL